MELRVLRYFVTVAEEGSISDAAKALHVTQPTLSRQLQDLERELDTKLLIRGILGAGEAVVDRGEDGVLQDVDILGVKRLGVDGDGRDAHVGGAGDLHHATARRGRDLDVSQLVLCIGKLLLHLLGLLHHLLHVHLCHVRAFLWRC